MHLRPKSSKDLITWNLGVRVILRSFLGDAYPNLLSDSYYRKLTSSYVDTWDPRDSDGTRLCEARIDWLWIMGLEVLG